MPSTTFCYSPHSNSSSFHKAAIFCKVKELIFDIFLVLQFLIIATNIIIKFLSCIFMCKLSLVQVFLQFLLILLQFIVFDLPSVNLILQFLLLRVEYFGLEFHVLIFWVMFIGGEEERTVVMNTLIGEVVESKEEAGLPVGRFVYLWDVVVQHIGLPVLQIDLDLTPVLAVLAHMQKQVYENVWIRGIDVELCGFIGDGEAILEGAAFDKREVVVFLSDEDVEGAFFQSDDYLLDDQHHFEHMKLIAKNSRKVVVN